MLRLFNKFRNHLSNKIKPKHPLPNKNTHTAYPEIQIKEDNSYKVIIYSYERKDNPVLTTIEGKADSIIKAKKQALNTMQNAINEYRRI
jgi:hypothetical protein